MSRGIFQRIVGLVIAIAFLALNAAAGSNPSAKSSRIEVAYSKNVELVGILANLTSLWDANRPNFPFAVGTREKFLPFKNLEAVGLAGDLIHKRSLGYLIRTAFRVPDLPEGKPLPKSFSFIHGFFLSRSLPAVRSFYQKSDFEAFWTENKPAYESWKSGIEEHIAGLPLPALLEEYFGIKKNRYTLVFTPQAARLRTWDREARDDQNVLVIFGPDEEAPDGRSFMEQRFLVTNILLRIIGHMWVLEILEKHPELVKKYAHLQENATRGSAPPAQPRPWRSVLLDNVRAAVMVRLTEKLFGPTASEEVLRQCLQEGTLLAAELAGSCREYEVNRIKYPTFESFLPDMLSRWEERAKR